VPRWAVLAAGAMTAASVRLADAPARPGLPGRARRRLFGISPDETRLARRGFTAAGPTARARLEGAGGAFVQGYLAALEADSPASPNLSGVDRERAGFAFEGAAMALALLDRLTPWRRDRWATFVAGPAAAHIYLAHVGAGWAWAKLGRCPAPGRAGLDPLLGWLAVDGFGFCHGYFNSRRFADGAPPPRGASGYAARAFDQGLGRSLWFAHGADPRRAAEAVACFPAARRADLWSGLGLACAYAGGEGSDAADALLRFARTQAPAVAQGVAFAAQARERAGNPCEATEAACRRVWGLPAPEAAAITDRVLSLIEPTALSRIDPVTGGAYEDWRQGIMAAYTARAAGGIG
jgi:hypothetical protein